MSICAKPFSPFGSTSTSFAIYQRNITLPANTFLPVHFTDPTDFNGFDLQHNLSTPATNPTIFTCHVAGIYQFGVMAKFHLPTHDDNANPIVLAIGATIPILFTENSFQIPSTQASVQTLVNTFNIYLAKDTTFSIYISAFGADPDPPTLTADVMWYGNFIREV